MLKVKNQVGRPTVMTESVLEKLHYAFSIGCTDEEACVYADIDEKTLYNFQTKNPEFIQLKEGWKIQPVLKKFNLFYLNRFLLSHLLKSLESPLTFSLF